MHPAHSRWPWALGCSRSGVIRSSFTSSDAAEWLSDSSAAAVFDLSFFRTLFALGRADGEALRMAFDSAAAAPLVLVVVPPPAAAEKGNKSYALQPKGSPTALKSSSIEAG